MIAQLRIFKGIGSFRDDDQGVAMTEALIALPFLMLLAAGILEFGAIFWQRQQIESGLRDAARYMARCRHPADQCQAVARNLAYFGSAAAGGAYRVPYWGDTTSDITFTTNTVTTATGTETIVTAQTTHQFLHSSMFSLLGMSAITITADHNQREIRW